MSGWTSTKSQKQHCKTNTLPNFPQTHGVTPPSKPLKRSLPAGLWLCNALIACGDPQASLKWSAERMLRNEFQPWPPPLALVGAPPSPCQQTQAVVSLGVLGAPARRQSSCKAMVYTRVPQPPRLLLHFQDVSQEGWAGGHFFFIYFLLFL